MSNGKKGKSGKKDAGTMTAKNATTKSEKKGKQSPVKGKGQLRRSVKMNIEKVGKTSIQIGTDTRDCLYRLKFRKSYDEFLKELCELYEKEQS